MVRKEGSSMKETTNGIMWVVIVFVAIIHLTGCATPQKATTPAQLVDLLAEQGTFKKVRVQTNDGTKVQVEYAQEPDFFTNE